MKKATRFLMMAWLAVVALLSAPVVGQEKNIAGFNPGYPKLTVLPEAIKEGLSRTLSNYSPAEVRVRLFGQSDTLGWENKPESEWAENDSLVCWRRVNLATTFLRDGGWEVEIGGIETQTPYRGVRVEIVAQENKVSSPVTAEQHAIKSVAVQESVAPAVVKLTTAEYDSCRWEESFNRVAQQLEKARHQLDSLLVAEFYARQPQKESTNFFLLGHYDDYGRAGGGVQVELTSGYLIGGSFSGIDWRGKSSLLTEVWFGHRLFNSLSITVAFVYDTNLEGYLKKIGGKLGLQINQHIDGRVNVFVGAGTKIFRVYQQEVLGRAYLYNDADPYILHLNQKTITPAARYWGGIEPAVNIGFSYNLD